MNDNDLSMTPFWARDFYGHSPDSLRAALGVLAGLLDDPDAFLNASRACRSRMMTEGTLIMPAARVIGMVASKYGMTVDELKSECRLRRYSWPRQEAYYRLREMGLSYPRIGRIMGRDHATVIHGVRVHRERERYEATRA